MTRTRLCLAASVIAAIAGCASSNDQPAGGGPSPQDLGVPESSITTVATGLRIPWGLAFLPDGAALVTERGNLVPTFDRDAPPGPGIPRIMSVTTAGVVTEVMRLPEVDTRLGEGGLLGIAVSPTYATDNWIYVYYSAAYDNRIARLRLGAAPQPILTGIPVSDNGSRRFHQGGRLAFGPDGMLYASVGETYFTPEIAQDPASLGGKILRMTPDGKPAPGGPFPNSLVWSYGHRNVQGLAWSSDGRMFASELGDKNYDELNEIRPGANYGWPVVEGPANDPRFVNPIASWSPTSTASPSGIAVLGNHIYVACLRGQVLYRVDLDGRNQRTLLNHTHGRLRAIAVGPDGKSLWISTSNLDQVGSEDRVPTASDGDRILRLTP